MNVKDGYLFPLVFECSAGFRYTAYVDEETFSFVSNQSGKIWTNDSKFSFEQFSIYVKDGSWKILTPQFNQTTELEECYAHIETLQEALEDAVKEILSLKHQLIAKAADTVIGIEKEGSPFKAISEYTLEDWTDALDESAVFEFYDGSVLTLNFVDALLQRVGFVEQSYLFSCNGGYHLENGRHIIKRIK